MKKKKATVDRIGRTWRRALLRMLACTGVMLAMGAAPGDTLKAAQAEETPLTNLAEGKLPTVKDSKDVTNLQTVTDGKKYTEQNEANRSDIKNNPYIQVDLGAEYSIEVINLKREENKTFQNTAIVLSSDADFSDAKVIYYQNESDLKSELPGATFTATAQGKPYAETYGGSWFYMEGDGTTATAPQTVKKARYVRVYSDAPDGNGNNIVELGVYGYKDESRMPEAVREKRKIDAENPLFIVPCYSSNYYTPGQADEPEFKGKDTVSGRWNAVPEHLRKYHVLLAHTDNLGMDPGQQFADTDQKKRENQNLLESFYEHCLRVGYEKDIPVMLLGITASAVPNGGTRYNVTAMMDYGWLDLMYRMYPNMEGTFNSENHWSGCQNAVGTGSAEQLNIAGRHNGYFAWTERSDFLEHNGVRNNANWKSAVEKNGEALYLMYKSTGAVGGQEYSTQSYMQGLWLAGYTAGWGGLIDTWAWSEEQQGPLGAQNDNLGRAKWRGVVSYPEAMVGAGLMSMYLEGATVYTMEHPAYTYGVDNKNSVLYSNVVEQVMEHIVKHPAPTRADILARTKALIYGTLSGKDIFTGLVGDRGTSYFLYDTGRYGSLPVMAPWKTKEELAAELARTCADYGVEMPAILDVNDPNLTGDRLLAYYNSKYPKEYNGDAFGDLWNDEWYVYNNLYDPSNIDQGQTAVLPLTDGANDTIRLKTTDLKAHTWFVTDRTVEGGAMEIYLNNYRTDKTGLYNKSEEGVSFAQNGDLAMADDQRSCKGLDEYVRQQMKSPKDNALRTTTWELTKLAEKPVVEVVEGLEWANGSSPQVRLSEVKFDPATGKATITVETNGWVRLRISNLKFVDDPNAEEIKDNAGTSGQKVNVAKGGDVTLSAQKGEDGRPKSRFTDEDTNKANYVEMGDGPNWVQVDMGGVHKVEELQLWRYWGEPDGRSYKDTVILLSPDKSFDPQKTLVVWNSSKGQINWPGDIRVPEGNDKNYVESQNGQKFSVCGANVQWLDPSCQTPKPQDGTDKDYFEAQYVRIYQNGRADDTATHNHLTELKVFGEKRKVDLVDTQKPTKPVDLKADASYAKATVSFAPATDNTGVKDYTLTLSGGGSAQTVNQTKVELTGLTPNTEYTVTVQANDNFGNTSDPETLTFRTLAEITLTSSLASGEYPQPQSVTLTASDADAEIYYTTDGSRPLLADGSTGASAIRYTGPISVDKGLVLNAAAKKDGYAHPQAGWFYLIGAGSSELDVPSAPANVVIEGKSGSTVTVSWTGTDASASSFKVYVNGQEMYGGNDVRTTITGLNPLTAYQIYVTAVDAEGNESLHSMTVEAVTSGQ